MFISFNYFIALQQQSQLSELRKGVKCDGADDFNQDTTTRLYVDWRNFYFSSVDVLIIRSHGEVLQTIDFAPKLIPSDQRGSNEWMEMEINYVKTLCENVSVCKHVLFCLESEPGYSKDYCLKKIRKLITNCTQEAGKDKHIFTSMFQ